MMISVASIAKAQFYDSADDIYYYVEVSKNGNAVNDVKDQYVYVLNFDGKKAAVLGRTDGLSSGSFSEIQKNIQNNPSFYEEKVETTVYDVNYAPSSYRTSYKYEKTTRNWDSIAGITWVATFSNTLEFASDRNSFTLTTITNTHDAAGRPISYSDKYEYKRVDKSYFKVGRSRTPSGTLHE